MNPIDETVLKHYRAGLSYARIGVETGLTKGQVGNIIWRLRQQLGEEEVPRRNQSHATNRKSKSPIGKASRLYKQRNRDAWMRRVNGIETWAGAFKVLAHYLRDKGDKEGWELAQKIAKAKGMKSL